MLDSAIKEQLRTIFAALEANYTFDITVSPQHESRTELLELLNDVASCSEKLSCRINEGKGLEFTLLKGEHRHLHGHIGGLAVQTGAIAQRGQRLTHHDAGSQIHHGYAGDFGDIGHRAAGTGVHLNDVQLVLVDQILNIDEAMGSQRQGQLFRCLLYTSPSPRDA